MSKSCFNCGKEIADSALFCTGCGSKQIAPVDLSDEPTVMAPSESVASPFEETVAVPNPEPVSPPVQQIFEPVKNNTPQFPEVPPQQYYQPPVSPPEPPKKNKAAVTVAVCAVILCIAMIATIAVLFITGTLSFNKDNKKDDEKDSETSSTEEVTEDITDRTYGFNVENNGSYREPVTSGETPSQSIIDNPIGSTPYTKGEVRNGEYVNEWAGFKFKITSEYPEADAATYNSLNSQLPAGEYGFISINQYSGTVLTISYEDNASGSDLETIFQSSIELTELMLKDYNPINFGSIEEINICGNEYLYSTMYYTGTNIYGIMLMRMLDNKIISVVITGETLSQCYSFLNTFDPAYPSI